MQKKLVILGAAESGVGAAILGKRMGYAVFVSDGGAIQAKYLDELKEHGIEFESGTHSTDRILAADEIVKSPGIPEKNELVKAIRAKAIPIISEIELAYRHMGNAVLVAITGSNGKTTTTALLHHMCVTGGLDCALVGNIGFSIARQVALDPKAVYIAEISSFQLDDIHSFRPHIAILTNITEDHLDRYAYKMENYVNSKFRITMNQTAADSFIYCADDPVTNQFINHFPITANLLPFTMNKEVKQGAFIKNEQMNIAVKDEKISMSIYDFALNGKHNQYNTMAAGIAAAKLGIRKEKIREAVQTFESLAHRMETVATVRGVQFINDSKATNVNSTWFALESMEHPTILIIGGVDKGNDYDAIKELVQEKVKAIVCLGIDNAKIHTAFDGIVNTILDTASAVDAVNTAFELAEKGDVVLLSPACASFDLFKNYEDRGDQFKAAVKAL